MGLISGLKWPPTQKLSKLLLSAWKRISLRKIRNRFEYQFSDYGQMNFTFASAGKTYSEINGKPLYGIRVGLNREFACCMNLILANDSSCTVFRECFPLCFSLQLSICGQMCEQVFWSKELDWPFARARRRCNSIQKIGRLV